MKVTCASVLRKKKKQQQQHAGSTLINITSSDAALSVRIKHATGQRQILSLVIRAYISQNIVRWKHNKKHLNILQAAKTFIGISATLTRRVFIVQLATHTYVRVRPSVEKARAGFNSEAICSVRLYPNLIRIHP